MRREEYMPDGLMVEQMFDDGSIAATTRKMLSASQRAKPLEERVKSLVDWERVAEMSLPALLYYVLMGDGRSADEFA